MSFKGGAASPFTPTEDGLRVLVRLTPRASTDAFEGVAELAGGAQALKAKVRAAPQDGAANRALIRLTAQTLGVAPSRIRLDSGSTSRLKTLLIEGEAPALAALLRRAG